jgi:hypothetical protein
MAVNISDMRRRGRFRMRNAAPREGRDHATLLPCAGAVVLAALAALAAEVPGQQPAAQSAPCTTIADDEERLACYDRALRAAAPERAAPAPAARTPAPAPAEPPQPAASTPAAEPVPDATASAEPRRDAGKETIAIVVVGVRSLPGRETAFTTQDGATWVQTDSQRVVGLPATPFEAELRAGAMGSNFLVPKNGARAIRVRPAER